ncbi:MAG: hypothetical protein OEZ65_08200 [Gemmatimonadota bacterium]|nr:hypothetical protein [Gemmatimonadota bacterium]
MITRFHLTSLLLAFTLLAAPAREARGQDLADAIVGVLDWIDGGYELVPENGQWGLAFGWFSEGEEKELRFTVTEGRSYLIAGGGDANSTDLDLCVYDEYGDEVECDQLVDNVPVVTFTATKTATYRAVLTAYSISGSTTYAGMAVLWEVN